ncbi:MAG: hypothetical protein GDA36_03195 [Rhodobacteraceae bacterium]|nr:hypothetical protein [Paracoccaceae bacterium]
MEMLSPPSRQAKAIGEVMPNLKDRLEGLTIRVPIKNYVRYRPDLPHRPRCHPAEEVNEAPKTAAGPSRVLSL